jgi:hypothetical protein
LFGGKPLCGYGHGRMSDTAVAEGGKTIVFHLDSLQSNVFFRNRLMPLRAVVEEVAAEVHGGRTATPTGGVVNLDGPAVAVAAHILTWSADGNVCTGIATDSTYCGPYRYFVPKGESLTAETNALSLSAMSVGQMCNDLAVAAGGGGLVVRPMDSPATASAGAAGSVVSDRLKTSRGSRRSEGRRGSDGPSDRDDEGPNEALYTLAADRHNLLVLTHSLEVASPPEGTNAGSPCRPKQPTLLVPLAPVLTLTRSATFATAAPVELGCKYGYQYWAKALGDDAA